MRRLTTLAAFAVFAGGCGSSGSGSGASESSQISAVVHRYFSAYAGGSGTELCPLLTQTAQDKMVEVVQSDERELGRSSAVHTCPEAVEFIGRVAQVENTKVLSVSITGTDAAVTVKAGNLHTGDVTLSKTATGWLINSLPGET